MTDDQNLADDNPPCQLYLITPPQLDLARFGDELRRACDGGPIACLQLRLKGATDNDVLRAAEALLPICRENDIAFVMNDRADLAAQCDADAVHLGQSDGFVAEARDLLGFDKAIGVTCHGSRHLAMTAGEQGADYVAFGAFFPSKTKDPPTMAEADIISWWTSIAELPCVAIGGITAENCAPLISAGADFLAVSHSVWNSANGPERAVFEFHDQMNKHSANKG